MSSFWEKHFLRAFELTFSKNVTHLHTKCVHVWNGISKIFFFKFCPINVYNDHLSTWTVKYTYIFIEDVLSRV